jgi:hypothetical protein
MAVDVLQSERLLGFELVSKHKIVISAGFNLHCLSFDKDRAHFDASQFKLRVLCSLLLGDVPIAFTTFAREDFCFRPSFRLIIDYIDINLFIVFRPIEGCLSGLARVRCDALLCCPLS